MVIMMKKLLLVPFILWCACCRANELCQTLQFRDTGVERVFKGALKESGITFSERVDGSITYAPKDQKRVCDIKQDLLSKYYANPVHHWQDSSEKELLEGMEKQGIPYEVFYMSDGRWITWLKTYDEKVQLIKNPRTFPKISIGDPDFEKLFLDALDAASIKYIESIDGEGRHWIAWGEKDRQRANEIYHDLRDRMREAAMKKKKGN